MCNKCIHKPVCYKYTVTGGYVRDCKDYKEDRRGQWVKLPLASPWKYRCDQCGCPQDYAHKFCPECAATMRGTKDA